MVRLIIFLLLVNVFAITTIYPGAKAYLDIQVFESLMNSYIPTIQPSEISDLNVTVGFLLSTMNFNFHNVSIQNFNLESSKVSISFNPKSDMITLVITDFSMNTTANFNLTWLGKTYQGHTSVSLTNATIKFPITIKLKSQMPSILIDAASGDLSSLLFHFKSSSHFLSLLGYLDYIWPLNHLDELLLKHSLSHIGTRLNPVLNAYFSALSYFPVLSQADLMLDSYFLEFGLSSPSSFEAGIVGMFLVPSRPSDTPPVLGMNASLPWQTQFPFRVQLTDFFLNSLLWALSDSGHLNRTISGVTSPSLKNYLTTTGLRLLVPGLAAKYGENLPVSLQCGLGQYPASTISPNKVAITSSCLCAFTVKQGLIELPGFTLVWRIDTSLAGMLNARGDGLELSYEVNIADTVFSQFNVTSSSIGVVDVVGLESALNFAIESVINFIDPNRGQHTLMIKLPEFMTMDNVSLVAYNRGIEIAGTPSFKFARNNK